MVRQNFTDVGYKGKNKRDPEPETWDNTWYCGDTNMTECQCDGVLYMGLVNANDTGKRIDTFDELRQYQFVQKKGENNWLNCRSNDFGIDINNDPFGEEQKQCWCEAKPQNVPTKCADDGGDCLCNGYVYYGEKFNAEDNSPANFYEIMDNFWTMNSANDTKNISCSPENFEGVDPLPGIDKQCLCDEEKLEVDDAQEQFVKEYWRGVMAER